MIFGAGIWGERIYKILNARDVPVHFFVDNNEQKWGSELYGIIIKSPDALKTYRGYVVIAVVNHEDEICEQLSQMGNARMRWINLREIEDKVI